jgi:hypothetical protein
MARHKKCRRGIAVATFALAIQIVTLGEASAHAPARAENLPNAPGAREIRTVKLPADGKFASAEIGPGRFELTYSGIRFYSRDTVEHYLLYRAALLARRNGATSFLLLYLPGEAGRSVHPALPSRLSGPDSSRLSGPDYGHWQPHWNYYVTGMGWQPWHPEWGAVFWADEIDSARVQRYEAHAIIELIRDGRDPEDQPVFNAIEVIKRLESIPAKP